MATAAKAMQAKTTKAIAATAKAVKAKAVKATAAKAKAVKAKTTKATTAKATAMKGKTKHMKAMKTPAAQKKSMQVTMIRIDSKCPYVYCNIFHTSPVKWEVMSCPYPFPVERPPLAAREVTCDGIGRPLE